MSQATEAPPKFRTVAELSRQVGGIPPGRVRLRPVPGTATEADLLRPENKLCELVDGILVEKTRGYDESLLTVELSVSLAAFVKRHRLGIALGTDGMFRLMPGLVRLPDTTFTSWDRMPRKRLPDVDFLDLAPDLAVEVLSKGNTKAEIKRKLREYFAAGVRVVWLIDPRTRTALVHTSPKAATKLLETQSLDGGEVLPGFALPLVELFECLDRGRDD